MNKLSGVSDFTKYKNVKLVQERLIATLSETITAPWWGYFITDHGQNYGKVPVQVQHYAKLKW